MYYIYYIYMYYIYIRVVPWTTSEPAMRKSIYDDLNIDGCIINRGWGGWGGAWVLSCIWGFTFEGS